MEFVPQITDEMLSALRQRVSEILSESRFSHTLAVEKEAGRICELILPNLANEMRAAALLHDLTKELALKEQQKICLDNDICVSKEAFLSAAVLHGMTAEVKICELFPAFATSNVLSAVRNHTVGHPQMTVFDKILFLADYIEETRPYPDCAALRLDFWEKISKATHESLISILDSAVFRELHQTLLHLLKKQVVIAPESLDLYNAYVARKDCQG